MSLARTLIWMLVVALCWDPSPVHGKGRRRKGSQRSLKADRAKTAPPPTTVAVDKGRPAVAGIERQFVVSIPEARLRAGSLRTLPADIGFELDVRPDSGPHTPLFDAVAAPWVVHERPVLGGTRIRVIHPSGTVAVAAGRHKGAIVLAFGVVGEEARLRALANMMRLPLPEPDNLGADLEVWQDAERVTAAGDLEEAKQRWERLLDVPQLADLAALRVAELFVASGHINEALARLRGVSREYPRSTGAALARLDVLHLEALTRSGTADVDQVKVATAVVDRPGFDNFAQARAAMVLHEMGEPALGLLRMPPPSTLPGAWWPTAEAERQTLVSLALAAPVLRDQPRASAIHHQLWAETMGEHADKDRILDAVAEAYIRLGLHDRAIPILQTRLRSFPPPVEEADIVTRLAHAYRMTEDSSRAEEALDYLVGAHPKAPGLLQSLRAVTLAKCRRSGIEAAYRRVVDLRDRAGDNDLTRGLAELEMDLALSWGTPAQIVHVLSSVSAAHPDLLSGPEGTVRAGELAVALLRAGRPAEAAPRLRELVDRQADPEARDRLGYHLAVAEQALGHDSDAQLILQRISLDGTRWGLVARAFLYERRLQRAVEGLEQGNGGRR